MNRDWHAAHRLPRNATFEERLVWHRDHAENCGCREAPESIKRELDNRGMLPPREPGKDN